MNIYILRHGIAAKRGASNLQTDRRRPLTDEGEKKMRKIAKAMKAMELSFDLILSSPFLRAKQTAEIVTEAFKANKRLEFADELAVGANPKALLARLDRQRPRPRDVLVVGHEPYLSSLISTLLSGSPQLRIELKKGGLAKLSVTSLKASRQATLEWLLTPKQMGLMA